MIVCVIIVVFVASMYASSESSTYSIISSDTSSLESSTSLTETSPMSTTSSDNSDPFQSIISTTTSHSLSPADSLTNYVRPASCSFNTNAVCLTISFPRETFNGEVTVAGNASVTYVALPTGQFYFYTSQDNFSANGISVTSGLAQIPTSPTSSSLHFSDSSIWWAFSFGSSVEVNRTLTEIISNGYVSPDLRDTFSYSFGSDSSGNSIRVTFSNPLNHQATCNSTQFMYGGEGYDFADAISLTPSISCTISLTTVTFDNLPQKGVIDPSTLTTVSSDYEAVGLSWQSKIWYDNGLYWLFYDDGTNFGYVTSSTGTGSWSSETVICSGCGWNGAGWMSHGGDAADYFAVWMDTTNNYVYVAIADYSDVGFAVGSTSSGGAISWSTSCCTSIFSGSSPHDPSIWGSSSNIYLAFGVSGSKTDVYYSGNDGSSWTYEAQYTDGGYGSQVLGFSDGYYVIVNVQSGALYVTTSDGSMEELAGGGCQDLGFDAVVGGNTVYVVCSGDNNDFGTGDYGVLGYYCSDPCSSHTTMTRPDTDSSDLWAAISLGSTSGQMAVFWCNSAGDVYYETTTNSGSTWDTATTISSSDIVYDDNSPFAVNPYASSEGGYALAWMTGSSSPYNLRYSGGSAGFTITQGISPALDGFGLNWPTDQTVAVSGCDATPSSFTGNGEEQNITALPSCILTLGLPAGYMWENSSRSVTITTCNYGYCGDYSPLSYVPIQSDVNVLVGMPPNECTAQPDPSVTITFNSTVITNGTNGNQWSLQMNSLPVSSLTGDDPYNLTWIQTTMDVQSNGTVFGWTEIFNSSTRLFTSTTTALATVTHIQAGDKFIIQLYQNDSTDVGLWNVTYTYYESATSQTFTASTVLSIPSKYYVPVDDWQINMVGEDNLDNPHTNFTSGGANVEYSSTQWQNVATAACVQSTPITGETSNMIYSVPVS